MKNIEDVLTRPVNRRSFIKKGAFAAGAVTVGAVLLTHGAGYWGTRRLGTDPPTVRWTVNMHRNSALAYAKALKLCAAAQGFTPGTGIRRLRRRTCLGAVGSVHVQVPAKIMLSPAAEL